MSGKSFSEWLLGKKPSEIPCFRTSFLTGVSSGLGVGIAMFLYSSNTRRSANYGFSGYIVVTASVWLICRYNYGVKLVNEKKFKKALQAKIMMEGTELDKKLARDSKEV
ncbi:hypothetical protein LSAT2_028896 [Lamellibrachia satsuma]|nr:hypothetical protein LSAT2_028896 [Lamellibrachia satsuma]